MPEASLRVRPAAPEDLDVVARMGAALVRLHHAWDSQRFFLVRGVERGYRRYFGEQLADPGTVILVAERAGRIVGYAYASLVERDWSDLRDACGKVHDVYVEEAARGAGAGPALLAEAVRRLEALGAPRVVLMVAARNEQAHALFGRLGFRETMIEMTRETGASAAPRRKPRAG